MGDVIASAAMAAAVAVVAVAVAVATVKAERERDAVAAAAVEMKERAVERFWEAPTVEVEKNGSTTRVQARYDVHLPALYLWDGENSLTILVWKVLPTVQSSVLRKNWHLCGLCWEDYESKNLHVTTYPYLVTTLTRLLKTARGE